MIKKISQTELDVVCERCGYQRIVDQRELYRTSNLELCKSCKATPAKSVMKNGKLCKPHRGEVDLDTMAPLDDNLEPYLPGHRICGMADCVAPSHILKQPNKKTPKPLIHEPGTGILKGQVITYDQFLEIKQTRRAS